MRSFLFSSVLPFRQAADTAQKMRTIEIKKCRIKMIMKEVVKSCPCLNERNLASWGSGVAHWIEHSTTDKIVSSNPPMRLCQPPNGSTSPKYKLLRF
jgi:hypothetical protein